MLSLGRFLKLLSVLIIYCILISRLSIISAAQPIFLKETELKSLGFTSYEEINPNLLVYPLKRLSEKIKFNLTFNKQKKKEYLYSLYEVRLKELVYIVNNKKEGFIFFTADRYNSFLGRLKKEYPPDSDFKVKIKDRIRILERMRDIYPANSLYWVKLQQIIDTTRSLI